MRSFYARVEHKAVVGVDIVNLHVVTSIILIQRHRGPFTTFPNSGIRARFMRSYYARVEHKAVVGVDVANSSCRY